MIILELTIFWGAGYGCVREGGIHFGIVSFVRLCHNSPVSGVNGRADALVVWQTAGQASGEGGAQGLPGV